MEMDAEILTSDFEEAMHRLGAAAKNSLPIMVRDASKLFARSAARWSPPAMGKQIPSRLFKRKIVAKPYCMAGNTKIHLDPKKYLDGEEPKGKGVKVEYAVLTKVSRSRKYKAVIVATLSAAKEKAKIETRGLLRAGWWGVLGQLGEQATEKYGSKVATLVRQVSRLTRRMTDTDVEFAIGNAVQTDASVKNVGMRNGLARATNAMNGMSRKLERKLAEAGK